MRFHVYSYSAYNDEVTIVGSGSTRGMADAILAHVRKDADNTVLFFALDGHLPIATGRGLRGTEVDKAAKPR